MIVGPATVGAIEQGLACAARGGTVVQFMGTEPGATLSLSTFDSIFSELRLVPSYSCGPLDTRRALELIERRVVRAEHVVTHRFPLAEAGEAYRVAALDKLCDQDAGHHVGRRAHEACAAAVRRAALGGAVHARAFRWRGVAARTLPRLAGGTVSGTSRQVLMAGSGGAPIAFDVRYFELTPGARTNFEQHRHAHVVIGLRGSGRVRLDRRWLRVGRLDTCYVAPDTPHELHNDRPRPFGFLCIVDASRDRGRTVAARQPRRARRENKKGAPRWRAPLSRSAFLATAA